MNLKNYLKDRSAAYIINIITLILVLIFLYVFRVSMQAVVIISVILFIGTLCAELWNFLCKKDYYSKLLNDLERLDKKYLISEMTEEPNFYDGKLLFVT